MQGEAVSCHVVGRDTQYVEMARNRFESITFFKRRDDVGLSSLQVFSPFPLCRFFGKMYRLCSTWHKQRCL